VAGNEIRAVVEGGDRLQGHTGVVGMAFRAQGHLGQVHGMMIGYFSFECIAPGGVEANEKHHKNQFYYHP
jgi:hypothetical protein